MVEERNSLLLLEVWGCVGKGEIYLNLLFPPLLENKRENLPERINTKCILLSKNYIYQNWPLPHLKT